MMAAANATFSRKARRCRVLSLKVEWFFAVFILTLRGLVVYYIKIARRVRFGNGVRAEKAEDFPQIIERQEYTELTTFRQQCYYLYHEATILREKRLCRDKLSYDDIGHVFKISGSAARYHIQRCHEELENQILPNGRPFSLNQEQIDEVKQWISTRESPPKLRAVRNYCMDKFSKHLFYL